MRSPSEQLTTTISITTIAAPTASAATVIPSSTRWSDYARQLGYAKFFMHRSFLDSLCTRDNTLLNCMIRSPTVYGNYLCPGFHEMVLTWNPESAWTLFGGRRQHGSMWSEDQNCGQGKQVMKPNHVCDCLGRITARHCRTQTVRGAGEQESERARLQRFN